MSTKQKLMLAAAQIETAKFLLQSALKDRPLPPLARATLEDMIEEIDLPGEHLKTFAEEWRD